MCRAALTIEGVEEAQIEARRIRLEEGISGARIDDAAEVMEIRLGLRARWHFNHLRIVLRVVAS